MHTPVPPLRQGDLDSLCGVYAVINAVRVLCPEVDQAVAEELFRRLVGALPKSGLILAHAVLWGMEAETLRALLGVARRFLREELDIRLAVRSLRLRQARPTLDDVWSALQAKLKGGDVAIIGLSGRHEHWTVGYRMTRTAIRLIDSDDLRVLLRSRCTLSRVRGIHRLDPDDLVVLSRKDWEW